MVKIVTDSSSDISPHLATELGITVVPVRISFGTKVYYDGIDMDRSSFYQQLGRSAALPTVEPPRLEELQQTYGQLVKGSDQILSIHSSSSMNKTVRVAQEAAKSFLGRSKIAVVDSRMISWGLALVVSMAAEAAARGSSVDDIVRLIRGMVPHIYMVFLAENLDYLDRGSYTGRGRMPPQYRGQEFMKIISSTEDMGNPHVSPDYRKKPQRNQWNSHDGRRFVNVLLHVIRCSGFPEKGDEGETKHIERRHSCGNYPHDPQDGMSLRAAECLPENFILAEKS